MRAESHAPSETLTLSMVESLRLEIQYISEQETCGQWLLTSTIRFSADSCV